MTANLRMTLTAAAACVLTSVVLDPLFTGLTWFGAGTGAVAAVAAAGALLRRRDLPVLVCLAGSLLGLLLYLNVVFEAGHSLLAVVPTPGSLGGLWHLAGAGIRDSRRYAPPAPDLTSLVFLAAAGTGIAAVATDLIAVRLRAAALAGLPLLVLFTVPVTMDPPRSQFGAVVVFCLATAGYLAVLGADGRERIRVWGRLVSLWRPRAPGRPGGLAGTDGPRHRQPGWTDPPETAARPDTRPLAAAGRRVGLASIVLALCAPLIVPGLHASKLFSSGPGIGGSGGGAAAAGLADPLSQTLGDLRDSSQAVVLTYRTDAPQAIQDGDPQYLQQYVLDTLTSSGWQEPDYAAGATRVSAMPPPPGLTDTAAAVPVTTTVQVRYFPTSGSQPTMLPVPYPPTAVSPGAPGNWLADPSLMVFSQGTPIAGTSYTVHSLAVDPTAAQLAAAPPPSGIRLARYLQLPASYKVPALEQIAKSVTAGARTEFAKADALALWLSGKQFTYTAGAPGFGTAAGLLNFLAKTRAGVCVQSAYAMTVLARLLGIPARVAVGYTAGTAAKTPGSYVVRTSDAHAWTEVYFTGYGWIRFEPTPAGQGTAQPPGYMNAPPGSGPVGGPPVVPAPVSSGSAAAGTRLPHNYAQQGGGAQAQAGGRAGGRSGTPWAAVALAVIAAIALAGGVIAAAAPPAARALAAARAAEGTRRRGPAAVSAAGLAAALAAIVALALYRAMSGASGPGLAAGWQTVGIAFGACCALLLAVPGLARVARRRLRWALAAGDAGRAHAAWRELRDDLSDFGIGVRPSEPPRTLAGRVAARLPEPARDAVRGIALAEERARYAARPLPSADLRRACGAARRGVAASVPRAARWRARIFPASVLAAIADGAARVPGYAAGLVTGRRPERAG
jgi:transglutaminase-like putative cysteine protease